MSSDIAISVKNLTKKYRIFGHPGDRIKQALTFGRVRFHREFTALRDVSFEIKKGETVGIIGRNGSGKSTLLQLVCGILKPTSGSVQVNGRVTALLELGAGFNPEFTGRENVYFQGAVMGISNDEMDRRFDDIAAFADIGEFIDQPVRAYSSGMFVRLAFSVASHTEPDVLVIDEALAVGDEVFQRKCSNRIRNLQEKGTSVLVVSHSSATVSELCNRVILLDEGELLYAGTPQRGIAEYQRLIYAPKDRSDVVRTAILLEQPGDQTIATPSMIDLALPPPGRMVYECNGARIENPRLTTPDGTILNILDRGKEYVFTYDTVIDAAAEHVRAGVVFKTHNEFELGGLISHASGMGIPHVEAGTRLNFSYTFRCVLLPGVYYMNCGVLSGTTILHRIIDVCAFRVREEIGLPLQGVVDFSPGGYRQ